MKWILRPQSLVLIVAGAAAASFGLWWAVAACALLWLIGWSWSVMHETQDRRNALVIGEDLRPESRDLLKPVSKLAAEMQALVDSERANETVLAVSGDVVAEANRVVGQCAASLKAREKLRKFLQDRYSAEKDIERVQGELEAAADEDKPVLEATLKARRSELARYDDVESAVKRIDASLKEAEAALAQMKARLSLSAGGSSELAQNEDSLREALLRVRAVTLSVDEAEELIRG